MKFTTVVAAILLTGTIGGAWSLAEEAAPELTGVSFDSLATQAKSNRDIPALGGAQPAFPCSAYPMNPGCPAWCHHHHGYPGCSPYRMTSLESEAEALSAVVKCEAYPAAPGCPEFCRDFPDFPSCRAGYNALMEPLSTPVDCRAYPAAPGCPAFCRHHHGFPGCSPHRMTSLENEPANAGTEVEALSAVVDCRAYPAAPGCPDFCRHHHGFPGCR